MARDNDELTRAQQAALACNAVAPQTASQGAETGAAVMPSAATEGASSGAAEAKKRVNQGLTQQVSTTALRAEAWFRALAMLNRFRVGRTIDVAVCCYADRPFKAALTAAQRVTRGLVKAGLVRRYRTDRFQTVYGLTERGAEWLEERDIDAASSVRRVSDMTNPEHRLWAQFLVLCGEARGLWAMTESELLQALNRGKGSGDALVQGLLKVTLVGSKRVETRILRPDAVLEEPEGGICWVEIDRSKRGVAREASLAALVRSIGLPMANGQTLRCVAVWCKSERIEKRAAAVVRGVAAADNPEVLLGARRHLCEVEPQCWEVRAGVKKPEGDGRVRVVDKLVGYIVVQRIPDWLPRVRVDARNKFSIAGWFGENYLPYRRPQSLSAWPRPGGLVTSSPRAP